MALSPGLDLLLLAFSQEELDGVVEALQRDGKSVQSERLPSGWRYQRVEVAWSGAMRPLAVGTMLAFSEAEPGSSQKLQAVWEHTRASLVIACTAAVSAKPVGTAIVASRLLKSKRTYTRTSIVGRSLLPVTAGSSSSGDAVLRDAIEYAGHSVRRTVFKGLKTLGVGGAVALCKVGEEEDKFPSSGYPAEVVASAPDRGLSSLVEGWSESPFLTIVAPMGAYLADGKRFSLGNPHAAHIAATVAIDFARDHLLRQLRPSAPAVAVDPLVETQAARLREATLERVVIDDFKNIRHLDLSFAPSTLLPGRWTCLAGVNGVGKSAVLQALAVVLLGPRYVPELGGAWLQRLRRLDGGARHTTTLRATLRAGDDSLTLTLPIHDRGVDLQGMPGIDALSLPVLWDARAQKHLLLAYGPGRNLSEHLDTRHDTKSVEVRRVMTLFDPLGQVASAEVILRERADSDAVAVTARRLLAEVLAGTPVTLAEGSGALRFSIGNATLSAIELPDGFRATIAWLVDLCAAWHEFAPEEARDGDPTKVRALVLLDEIDLHLHPRLQRVLIPRLRRALPLVQWVVTTHSPLVLASFDRREIIMLEPDADGLVQQREVDRQVLGFSVDEVYRWLMDTEPRSAALEEAFPDAPDDHDARARYAMLLAQSPEHDEASVREAYAFRAQKLRERAGGFVGVREAPPVDEEEGPESEP
jgi:hypothetical protein